LDKHVLVRQNIEHYGGLQSTGHLTSRGKPILNAFYNGASLGNGDGSTTSLHPFHSQGRQKLRVKPEKCFMKRCGLVAGLVLGDEEAQNLFLRCRQGPTRRMGQKRSEIERDRN
jgi:hypothetical protein